ncbi:GntR family transcriptional regulator [Rhodoligotrophos defluvii]|uniref:GntR family transcriptional regulator n=1 Tax=Rhodoligotrophos defluvii TaxID=2561934 RepID=UPI0010C9DA8D|nr:GntR family transcriptional regulator [Rhodoligotrophos defluvii]
MAEADGQRLDLRIQPTSVQKQTVERLRDAIVAGIFKPGDRLVESQLCSMLGVSRASLREALRSLEAERLIAFLPNRGTLIPVLSWQEAHEIYHVRAILEGEAAALCAERASPKDLAEMTEALQGFAAAVEEGDSAGLLKETARFYEVILARCGNAVIAEILQGLNARISFLRNRSMSRPGRARFSLAEMQAILNAIERKDKEGARQAAVTHVEKASDAARQTYSESGELRDGG